MSVVTGETPDESLRRLNGIVMGYTLLIDKGEVEKVARAFEAYADHLETQEVAP